MLVEEKEKKLKMMLEREETNKKMFHYTVMKNKFINKELRYKIQNVLHHFK